MAEESNPTAVPRRAMLHGAGLSGAFALLAGMREARAANPSAFPQHPHWRFVFVNHVTTNPFFVPTQYGIQDACALLDCDHQWTGSTDADGGQMGKAVNAGVGGH